MVLAAMRPELEVHLIEPMERRVNWLTEVREELDLDNVEIHHCRAEELHGKLTVTAVTARAVAALDKLARMTMPLVKPGGVLLAQKGRRAEDEVTQAQNVLARLGGDRVTVHEVDLLGDGEVTRVVKVVRQ